MKNQPMQRTPSLLMVTTVPVTVRGFLLPFAEYFHGRGWRVDVASSGVEELRRYPFFDNLYSVPWTRLGADLRNHFASWRTIRKVLRQGRYDIVHVHTPIASFITRLATVGLKPRPTIVYTAHGFHFHPAGRPVQNLIFAAAEKLAGLLTAHLIVINRHDEQTARRLRLVKHGNLHYMPGIGVNTRLLSPEMVDSSEVAAIRESLGVQHKPLFLMLAEFSGRKRHRDILHAWRLLSGRTDAVLALAGDGPLTQEMRILVEELDIADRVRFLGMRSDVPALIRASDVVVLVSDQEGLPRSIMEALSLEVPVIGTRIRGVEELLSEGVGLLVEVGDIRAMADAAEWMLHHESERRAMGKRGRERMQREFDLKNIVALHDCLYSQILVGRRK